MDAEKASLEEDEKERGVARAAASEAAAEAEKKSGADSDSVVLVAEDGDDVAGVLVDVEDDIAKGQLREMWCVLQKHGSKIKLEAFGSFTVDEKLTLVAAWAKSLVRVDTWVSLVTDNGLSDVALPKIFQDSPTARFKGNFSMGRDSRFLLWWGDLKLQGEAASQPHVRVTPFKADQIRRLLSVALQTGMKSEAFDGNTASFNSTHLFRFMEGFKTLEPQLSNFFTNEDPDTMKTVRLQKEKRIMTVAYSQASMESRRVCPNGCISQFERIIFYSANNIEVGRHIPVKDRVRFTGSNVGDLLGFAQMVKPGSMAQWKETFCEKKAMYGSKREEVGNKGGGPSGSPEGVQRVRQNEDVEPVCYWSTPTDVLFTVLDGEYPIGAVNDFAVGDAGFAYCCIIKQFLT